MRGNGCQVKGTRCAIWPISLLSCEHLSEPFLDRFPQNFDGAHIYKPLATVICIYYRDIGDITQGNAPLSWTAAGKLDQSKIDSFEKNLLGRTSPCLYDSKYTKIMFLMVGCGDLGGLYPLPHILSRSEQIPTRFQPDSNQSDQILSSLSRFQVNS